MLGDAPDYVNAAVGDITLGALATHTSGLPGMPANFAPRDAQDPYANYTGALLERGVGNSRPGQPPAKPDIIQIHHFRRWIDR